ncbi:MAG: hypothetical protein WBX09_20765, partial [Terracidiphilus sp.]
DNIDDVFRILSTQNNGLFTNEWIMGDDKTNEIAIFDLVTNHTKLWRSSKNEWFGGTPGFYWGDNNAKDLTVRLEDYPDPNSDPEFIPYVPRMRDTAWQQLYQKYRGKIDEQFGFLAYRTAPLVAASTMDAKVVTADMASNMMVWAEMGRPNQREWLPNKKYDYTGDDGLYPSGYYLFQAEPTATLRAAIEQNEKTRLAAAHGSSQQTTAQAKNTARYDGRLWKGWVLPASDSDSWFVAGSAEYEQVLQSNDVDEAMNAQRAVWRSLQAKADSPLDQYRRERSKGVLFLDSLRVKMGDDAFLKLMRDYFAANTTKTVTAQSFLEKAGLNQSLAHLDDIDPPDGPMYLVNDIWHRVPTAIIVYGTLRDAGANRYAAEQWQHNFLDDYESQVPIYKDFAVSDDLLRDRDVVFIGRPESNSALVSWSARLGLDYQGAAFKIDNEVHAWEREALILAAKNPLDATHMVLVVAGNDALSTVKTQGADLSSDEYMILRDGESPVKGFIVAHTASSGPPAHAGK